jgi:hypothetical protein
MRLWGRWLIVDCVWLKAKLLQVAPPHPREALGFNLADALTVDVEVISSFFECSDFTSVEVVSEQYDISIAFRQNAQRIFEIKLGSSLMALTGSLISQAKNGADKTDSWRPDDALNGAAKLFSGIFVVDEKLHLIPTNADIAKELRQLSQLFCGRRGISA